MHGKCLHQDLSVLAQPLANCSFAGVRFLKYSRFPETQPPEDLGRGIGRTQTLKKEKGGQRERGNLQMT